MKVLMFLCALSAHLALITGFPSNSGGVSAFAYEDSTGNRYGGTYELKDGKVRKTSGNLPVDPPENLFGPNFFPDLDNFFPSYFRNFENILQDKPISRHKRAYSWPSGWGTNNWSRTRPTRYWPSRRAINYWPTQWPRSYSPNRWSPSYWPTRRFPSYRPYAWPSDPYLYQNWRRPYGAFKDHFDNQQKALGAAEKAYELTSNQAGHLPHLPDRFRNFGGYNNFMNPMSDFMSGMNAGMPAMPDMGGMNAAYAGAFANPSWSRQIASITPGNPYQPNVDVTDYAPSGSGPGYVSVSSKSYSSSSNINGQPINHRGSETYVNQNGRITSHKVSI